MNDELEQDDGDCEQEDYSSELFGFYIEDRHFIKILRKHIKKLLHRPSTTPNQMYHIAKLLFAFDRLPLPTPGISIELTLVERHANGESNWQAIHLDDSSFRASTGAWVIAAPSIGGDAETTTVLDVEVGGYRDIADPVAFMDWVEEFAQRASDAGQDLDVSDDEDESKIDWDVEDGSKYWDELDSDCI